MLKRKTMAEKRAEIEGEHRRGIVRKGFDFDVVDGEAVENSFGEMLLERTCGRIVVDGEERRRATIEVKGDKKQRRTGNIFLEYSSRGKPSGIMRPGASEWWAVEIEDDCFIVMRAERLRLVGERVKAQDKTRWCEGGGDFKAQTGVKIPVSELMR